jgi:hypothetical protein
VYAEPEEEQKERSAEAQKRRGAEEPLIPPPPEEMEVLYELALIGSMRDIRERADYLETLDEQYLPFADTLRQLAKDFEEQEILALVERYMKKECNSATETQRHRE